ncbi:MAG TPA: hypothetical protein VFY63_06295, partial [Pseudorhizobium sp.]|nr:hypothetical protein [Pseudorhizobium sp.]
ADRRRPKRNRIMIRLSPVQTVRETLNNVTVAVSAAREYRDAASLRQGANRPANPATAGIPL